MGWKANRFSDMGYTLSGRDALNLYGLTSSDDFVTFIESDSLKGSHKGVCFCKKDNSFNIIEGKKCAKLEKSMLDYMMYPYDDSGIEEALEYCDEEDIAKIVSYAKKNNLTKYLTDYRWKECFEELL